MHNLVASLQDNSTDMKLLSATSPKMSFARSEVCRFPRTSLNRGLLNRGSIVIRQNKKNVSGNFYFSLLFKVMTVLVKRMHVISKLKVSVM